MTDITSSLQKIQVEETQYKSAISEATAQKTGGTINWIIDNFQSVPAMEFSRAFKVPFSSGDMRIYFPFDFHIKAASFSIVVDASGSTSTGTFDFLINGGASLLSAAISINQASGLQTANWLATDDAAYSGDHSSGMVNNPTMSNITVLAGSYIKLHTNKIAGLSDTTANFTLIGNRIFS